MSFNRNSRMIRRTLPLVYGVSRSFYRMMKAPLGPLARRHPRFHRFALSVKETAKSLLIPPETVPPSAPPTAGVEQGTPHERPEHAPRVSALPQWLIDEWREIHTIEPQLFPDPHIRVNVVTDFISPSRVGAHYLELSRAFGGAHSHVFLVPWLKRGGADLVTLNYVRALLEGDLARSVMVVATENADSPWAERLHPKAKLLEFGKAYGHLSAEEQEKLLVRVLLQTAPDVIHLINSLLGYRVFITYGKALAERSRLFASAFCEDITPEGRSIGYPVCFLPECFDTLTAVFTDNRFIVDRLCGLFAFEREKFHVHYQPVDAPPKMSVSARSAGKEHLDILWASRLDIQKRPDILIGIAERCQGFPFTFHVYGSPVYGTPDNEAEYYVSALKGLPNVRYYGEFDGLLSLPLDRYDLFLYTSQWDGLPNVLLEAVSQGLPVIASRTGGVPDIIVDGETGFLVDPYDDVGGFVNCLREVHHDRSVPEKFVRNAQALVACRHSPAGFAALLTQCTGYVFPGDRSRKVRGVEWPSTMR